MAGAPLLGLNRAGVCQCFPSVPQALGHKPNRKVTREWAESPEPKAEDNQHRRHGPDVRTGIASRLPQRGRTGWGRTLGVLLGASLRIIIGTQGRAQNLKLYAPPTR